MNKGNNGGQTAADLELQKRIQELIAFKGGGYNEDEVADILENALKLLTDVKDTGDVRVIQTALARIALLVPAVRAVCAHPQGHDFWLGADASRANWNISRPSSSGARL